MKKLLSIFLIAATAVAQSGIDTSKWRVIDHQTIYYWPSIVGLTQNTCSVPGNVSVTNELQLRATNVSATCQGADWGPVTYGWSDGNIENKTLSLTSFSATAVMKFPANTHSAFWFERSDLCQYPTDAFNYQYPCNFTYAPYPANPYLDSPNYYEIDAVEYLPTSHATAFGFSVHYANGLYTTNWISDSTIAAQYHTYTFQRNAGTLSISIDGGTATTMTDPSPTIPVYPLFGMWVDQWGTPTTSETFHVASLYICSDPATTCTATSPTLIFDGGFSNPYSSSLGGAASFGGGATLQ